MQAKKVAVSGGLSTVWGFYRLGGRYFKNWRMLYCAELNSTTQHQNLRQNMFHSDDNCSELCAILDDLPIEINVFSHICILHHCLHLKTHVFFNLIAYLDLVNNKIYWR